MEALPAPTPDEATVEILPDGQALPANIRRAPDMRKALSPKRDIPPPGFLVEGAMCEAMADIKMTMDALCAWAPDQGYTMVQSAQGTCRVVAHQVTLILGLCGRHRNLGDPRWNGFRRMTAKLSKQLLMLEPCAPDVTLDTDPRICESIRLICKYLEHGDKVLDTRTAPRDRKAALKDFHAEGPEV